MSQLQHEVASTFLSQVYYKHPKTSEVNVVSAFYHIQEGRAYSIAAVQHPSRTRGNRRMVCRVLHLTEQYFN